MPKGKGHKLATDDGFLEFKFEKPKTPEEKLRAEIARDAAAVGIAIPKE